MSKPTKQRQIANRIRELLENEDTVLCKRKTRDRWYTAPSIRGLYPELFSEIDNLLDTVLTDRRPPSERGMAAAIAYKLILDKCGERTTAANIVSAVFDGEYDAPTIQKYYRERYTREADNVARNAGGFVPDDLIDLARYVRDNFKDGKLSIK